jgi:hypothetical protein
MASIETNPKACITVTIRRGSSGAVFHGECCSFRVTEQAKGVDHVFRLHQVHSPGFHPVAAYIFLIQVY